ncbi:MAG: hypothetical protein NC904_08530 [Candidatus Omnitrophica bacterium]|nr:hypothetical protein [Candidatus Omnitrophota bacterium]
MILATVFGGLLTVFVGERKFINRTNQRLTAVNLAQQVLNRLYFFVRADMWNNGKLSIPQESPWQEEIVEKYWGNLVIKNNYEISYTVSQPQGREYRQVDVTVKYNLVKW